MQYEMEKCKIDRNITPFGYPSMKISYFQIHKVPLYYYLVLLLHGTKLYRMMQYIKHI